MSLSAKFCREQAGLQLAKATGEPLENRRNIALAAVQAWKLEAIRAEKRELKQEPLDKLDTEIALEFALETIETAANAAQTPAFPVSDGDQ